LALPVLFGFAMLAIDGGRFFNLQTSLQAAADALALAGAAERGTAAARNIIRDTVQLVP
jgi:Flp pilus assembly protein TadG